MCLDIAGIGNPDAILDVPMTPDRSKSSSIQGEGLDGMIDISFLPTQWGSL
jgi:hypothetical protein